MDGGPEIWPVSKEVGLLHVGWSCSVQEGHLSHSKMLRDVLERRAGAEL